VRASVAVSGSLTGQDVAALRAAGLDPIPELGGGGIDSWLGARGQLKSQVALYRIHGSFHYLVPREGFTIVDYLLGRQLGGAPIQSRYDILGGGHARFDPGDVLVATLGADRGHDRASLLASIRHLERRGITVSSVQQLTASG
jgi:hypothetical protein